MIATLLIHFTSNYTAMVHLLLCYYYFLTVLMFANGVQLTVLHHFTVSEFLLSQTI